MLLASFLNASAVVNYLCTYAKQDILIVCSGWKGRFCIEDMLLAGFLSNKLLKNDNFSSNSDSTYLAQELYQLSTPNLFNFLESSSYRKRMNVDEDVKYCLQIDIMNIVPVWCLNKIKSGAFSAHKK